MYFEVCSGCLLQLFVNNVVLHEVQARLNNQETEYFVKLQSFCPFLFQAWYNVFISYDSDYARFLKHIEQNTLKTYYQADNPMRPYLTADQAIMAAFLDDDVIKQKQLVHMAVEVTGSLTRGQGVVDWNAKNGNVTLILELDLDMYSKLMYTAIQRR